MGACLSHTLCCNCSGTSKLWSCSARRPRSGGVAAQLCLAAGGIFTFVHLSVAPGSCALRSESWIAGVPGLGAISGFST